MNNPQSALATSLGTYAPRHYLIAAFDDSAHAEVALDALRSSGFAPTAIATCPGSEFLASWKRAAGHQGFFSKFAALFPSEEHEALEDYLAEARLGASLVSIHISGRDEIFRARDVLRPLGAFDIRYFGNFTITDLNQDRNATP